MTFGGRKQSFSALSFLNWQRAKVLLKLEFDTEDQVLFHIEDLKMLPSFGTHHIVDTWSQTVHKV